MNENIDYKKLAEDAREFSITCEGMGLSSLSSRSRSYADAIELLLAENQRLIDMWRGATGRCSMCKHFRPVPQGCNLPNYKVCTDENDLWEPEPIIYKN